MDFAKRSQEVFKQELTELEKVSRRIGNEMNDVVDLIYSCSGKVVVTGIGKTGIIGHKIASSLASTGTPSFFMNAAEAMHGDLGMISKADVVIVLSNSGTSQEVLRIVGPIKRIGCPIVAITGNPQSTLAKESDYVLDVAVEKEACPLGLAPTSSTTAALIMGDALVVSLIERRNFKSEEFALYHPGGALGKRLLVRVRDVMHSDVPLVREDAPFKDVIYEVSNKRLGMTIVSNMEGKPVGIITDGDIRRAIQNFNEATHLKAKEFMTIGFKSVLESQRVEDALCLMENNKITTLAVMKDKNDTSIIGIIHIHDIFEYKK